MTDYTCHIQIIVTTMPETIRQILTGAPQQPVRTHCCPQKSCCKLLWLVPGGLRRINHDSHAPLQRNGDTLVFFSAHNQFNVKVREMTNSPFYKFLNLYIVLVQARPSRPVSCVKSPANLL